VTHREDIHGSYNRYSGYYRANRIGRNGEVAEDIFHGGKTHVPPILCHECSGVGKGGGQCLPMRCDRCGKICEDEK
jgi:hypothetical protein